VYAVLALLAFLENIVPIVPADVAVALGAFLSHHGTTKPLAVFLIAWTFNTGGAMLVYALVRRSGRGFFELPVVRRLMAPEAIAVIERDYLRLGVFGLVVARFLPGIRAVVAPFAGMFRIPAWRVFLVMALVSGVWYGAITWIGTVAGNEFDRVQELLHQMGRTTALMAVVLAVIVGLFFYARRRRREEPVITAVKAALGASAEADVPIDLRHAAQLVIEIAYADAGLASDERTRVENHLRQRWGLAPRTAPEPSAPRQEAEGRLRRLGQRLSGEVERERRLALIEQMWQSLFSDRTIDSAQEAWLLAKATEVLGLAPEHVEQVRSRLAHDSRLTTHDS
jgi:membrane protein DedA with SNARE-associated domain/uncharacterized tellurite resistance protein B-like protein